MKLVSLNVGRPRLVMLNGQSHSTAIFKSPVAGRVMARRLNLDGDKQANLSVHGGEHKAVYAYAHEHYAAWREELGREDLGPGQFGENFTVEGLLEDEVCIGDRFRIGGAAFEVTQPRVPCMNLAIRMDDPGFPKRFLKSQRSGFYLRVVEEGEVGAGDTIARVHEDPSRLTVRAVHTLHFFDRENREGIRSALEVEALSDEWRRELTALLRAGTGA